MALKFTSYEALIKDARIAWKALDGLIIVYKPTDCHHLSVQNTILKNICQDLKNMDIRPHMQHVHIEGNTNGPMDIVVKNQWADHPRVCGPRYVNNDIRIAWSNALHQEACGVQVFGINHGAILAKKLRELVPTKFYKVKGILGQARSNFTAKGKIIEKSTWKHIKRLNIDSVCSAMQAAHQKKMFEICGVDMQSQAAYEIAVRGPIRPVNAEVPIIYNIKCVDFQPPEFTLEIVCVNEHVSYLQSLVHDIGIMLKSTAYCSFVQCTQYSLFNIKDALLSKHWDLENLLQNMDLCKKIVNKNQSIIFHDSPNLIDVNSNNNNEI